MNLSSDSIPYYTPSYFTPDEVTIYELLRTDFKNSRNFSDRFEEFQRSASFERPRLSTIFLYEEALREYQQDPGGRILL